MELKFRDLKWEHECGTREKVKPGFEIELNVWDYNNVCVWSIGNTYTTFEKGRCKTREQAKIKAEIAFIEYVYRNLEKCCEE